MLETFFVYTTRLNSRIIVKNNVLKQMTSCLTHIENILSYNSETAQKYIKQTQRDVAAPEEFERENRPEEN